MSGTYVTLATSAYRILLQQIADRIGVSEPTLRRHYPEAFKAAELNEGRPAFQPTPEQRKLVIQLAGIGIPHNQIVSFLSCSEAGERSIGHRHL